MEKFITTINNSYQSEGKSFTIGAAMLDGNALQNAEVKIPLRTLNRHGLIAGATGTGKTVSLQVLAEQFSLNGIPTLLMDMKGDLSGLAAEGTTNKHIEKRHSFLTEPWTAKKFPVEILTLSSVKGTKLKATVTEFGPILMSKVLGLNDTQGGVLSVLFKYCDNQKLPLINLEDLKKALQYAVGEGESKIQEEYGKLNETSVSTILRKIIELESQGADVFFQEPSFDVNDFLRFDENDLGMISILRLSDINDKPKLFSTFMLSLLAEIYSNFPEQGDSEKPKLCLFIDEAHLIFENASKELLNQIETIIKLIRSKGVGIFFCTQSPKDIPNAVLSQLGLKIQHSLRAFTAKDRKDIKSISENFPESDFYKIDDIITSLGIGEAFVTALDEKGRPTTLVATLMRPPKSRIGILNDQEFDAVVNQSKIKSKYNQELDRESAEEILSKKIEKAKVLAENSTKEETPKATTSRKEESLLEELSKNTMVRQVGRTLGRELMRGILGILGVKRR